ncbi:MAG: alpha-hydroxy-acid oxidizing protein [bacterium]
MDGSQFRNFGPERQREIFLQSLGDNNVSIPTDYEKLRSLARESMEDGPFGYVDGNAGLNETTRNNSRAFEKWQIQPRVLRGIEDRTLSTDVLGNSLPAPLFLAPVGVQSIIHPDGALASARAASDVGVPFVHSTVSSFTIEDVGDIDAEPAPWFQLYWSSLNELNKNLTNRAEEKGYQGIIITLDTPIMGWRPRDLDQGYLPFLEGDGLSNYTSDPAFLDQLDTSPDESLEEAILLFFEIFSDPSVNWSDLRDLISTTDLPVLVKGIMHPEDGLKAVENGARGVVVSNHGGRQIDGEMPALDALEPTVEALPDDRIVLFDSGIRSGSDVFKALALGADSVLLGRPYLYGLGAAGEDGVRAVIKNILAEFDITLGLSGYANVDSIQRDALKETSLKTEG